VAAKVEKTESEKLEASLKRIVGAQLAKIVGKVYGDEIVYRRFQSDNNRARYEDLSPKYKAEKRLEVGHVYPILDRTGDFRKSLQNYKIKSATSEMVTLEFTVPAYMREHREGTGGLPKREPVSPNAGDMAALTQALKKRLT
jgi:hypothetical protein